MKWLVGYVVAGIVGGFLVVRIFEYFFGGAQSALANAAKASLFAATWTAIISGSGMRDLSAKVRGLGRRLNTRR